MEKLLQFQSDLLALTQMQNRWASVIQPVLDLPPNSAVILPNIILSSSSIVSHQLGRPLIGWHIVRQRGAATVYDRQDTNLIPDKTLLLSASSGVSVDLLVF